MIKNPITVVLVEDHAIVREGLRSLLELSSDFLVIGEAADGRDAVKIATKLKPDIIVMDVAMPVMNGFEATRQIRMASPKTKLLALSAHSDDEYVEHLLSAGVSGYLIKQNSGQVLLHAIREVFSGRLYFSPEINERRLHAEQNSFQQGHKGSTYQTLTPREAEVLQLVAEGSANKQMATALGISIKTVEKHRQTLMDKLNIHDTAGLTRYAIATGVIESSIQGTTKF